MKWNLSWQLLIQSPPQGGSHRCMCFQNFQPRPRITERGHSFCQAGQQAAGNRGHRQAALEREAGPLHLRAAGSTWRTEDFGKKEAHPLLGLPGQLSRVEGSRSHGLVGLRERKEKGV